jgi:small-conductance mechanosensitive channel
LILSRTYYLVNELIDAQSQVDTYKKSSAAGGSADVATLKKQVAQQQEEYNRLSEELAKAKGQAARTKAD